ncbi:MAG: 16S rRNA (adenine(1518)-N(6)/adenine(1519)-N(6))-dimethyltransferase RsmA [Trichlorobacter sp.]|nr:16S rRNA (adenine(1518)-N(6)/adenine(1519)-N(6))-dimethyltransferase RsmA [Trichlorobacter sp.]
MTTIYPRPKKALGQNFLTDNNIVAKILTAADIQPEDHVLEVGPGRGALTNLLTRQAKKLVCVEFDRELAEILRQQYKDNHQVTIHEQDILKVDFASLLGEATGNWKVVANLPYNISTPVLFRFLEERKRFSRLVLMLQKEVGERLSASPGSGDYGIITVLLGLWFEVKKEFLVASNCFYPAPKVDSVVISLVPRKQPLAEVKDEQFFRQVVKASFAQRRKTLHNCLKAARLAEPDKLSLAFEKSGIDGKRRGETLSIAEFAELAQQF